MNDLRDFVRHDRQSDRPRLQIHPVSFLERFAQIEVANRLNAWPNLTGFQSQLVGLANVGNHFCWVRVFHLTFKVNIFTGFALGKVSIPPPLINMFGVDKTERLENPRCCPVKPLIEAGHEPFPLLIAIQALVDWAEWNVLWISSVVPHEKQHPLVRFSVLV